MFKKNVSLRKVPKLREAGIEKSNIQVIGAKDFFLQVIYLIIKNNNH